MNSFKLIFVLVIYNVTVSNASFQNWEFQMYYNNRSNSYVKDSNLVIRPGLTSDDFGEAFLSSGVLNLHGGAPADQ